MSGLAGGAAFLSNSSFTISNGDTIYVFAYIGNITTTQVLIEGASVNQQLNINTSGHIVMNAGAGLTSSAPVSVGAHAICGVFNGASSALYIDSSSSAAASGNGGTNALTNVIVGGIGNGPAASTTTAEIVIVSGADSSVQRAQMFAYAALRYGQKGVWA